MLNRTLFYAMIVMLTVSLNGCAGVESHDMAPLPKDNMQMFVPIMPNPVVR